MKQLPFTKEKPIRRIKSDELDIKVYEDYVMIDRQSFESILSRGRFYWLYSKVCGLENLNY